MPDVSRAIDEGALAALLLGSPGGVGHRGPEDPSARGHDDERNGRHREGNAPGEDLGDGQERHAEDRAHPEHQPSQGGDLVEAADLAPAQVDVQCQTQGDLEEDRAAGIGQGGLPDPGREVEVVAEQEKQAERQHPRQSVPADHR